MHQITAHPLRRLARGALLAAALLLLAVAGLRPAPAYAACGGPTVVTSTSELSDAIDEFNSVGSACDFEIEFGSDITLNEYLPSIDNSISGVSLLIDGAGYTLDGDGFIETLFIFDSDVTIDNLTIANSWGDGVDIEEGTLRVSRSTIWGSDSAAIDAYKSHVVVVESTLAYSYGYGIESYDDSGIYTLSMINTTVTGNGYQGVSLVGIDAVLTHVTVNGNSGGLYISDGDVTVNNSILADNYDEDCSLSSGTVDVNFSLVQNDSPFGPCGLSDGVDGNIVGQEAWLGVLGNNGGPTSTVPLLQITGTLTAASPAINAGSNALSVDETSATLTTDQRGAGFPRNDGGTVDMGAYEGPLAITCSSSATVSSEPELNYAILCFNLADTPGQSHTITFEADITLTHDLHNIDNNTDDISLLIDGDGYTLDGDGESETFIIENTADVAFDRITIANAIDDGIDAWGSNLRVSRSTIRGSESDGIQFTEGELIVTESTLLDNFNNALDLYDQEVVFTVLNSTFAGNGWLDGGPAISLEYAAGTLTHVTVVNNEGGIWAYETVLTINNSILADNGYDCSSDSSTVDVNYSLIKEDNVDFPCGAIDGVEGNITGESPMLLSLGNYGGPTQTMPPYELTGSVSSSNLVVDAGSNALAVDEDDNPLTTDQRGAGFPRLLGPAVEMGAVEGLVSLDCPAFPITATNEDELNTAFLCYRGLTAPGVYIINLGDDIDLTAATSPIVNSTANISLIIDGDNRTIDGHDTPGARPLTVGADTDVTLNDLILTGGNSDDDGGGINNKGFMTLNSVSVIENATNNNGGGIYNDYGATMSITDSVIGNNTATYPDGDGGGINNDGVMTITDSLIDSNIADGDVVVLGGGILNEGDMTLIRVTVSGNRAASESDEAFGGGINNQASLLIRDSAILNNDAIAPFEALGGGIYSAIDSAEEIFDEIPPRLMIINSTISGNIVAAEEQYAYGGGLYATDVECCEPLDDPIPVTIINSTIAGNTATANDFVDAGGAFFELSDSETGLSVNIHNSILAGNTTDGTAGGDCALDADPLLLFSSLHSLYEDTDDGACGLAAANPDGDGNIVGQAPNLGSLADNGGPTLTHLPAGNSPAVDSGDNSLAVDENDDTLTADQRGHTPRVFNGTVDMGAVEVGATGPVFETAIYMSTTASGTTSDGVAFDNSDILMWDGAEWSKFFDGTDAHLDPSNKPKHNVNAFWVGEGQTIMSFAQNGRRVNGLPGKVDGMDLVRWDGSAFSLWFDGSDVGLANKTAEKIDGLHVLDSSDAPDEFAGACVAYLLVSTQGPGAVPAYGGGQIKFSGEDVLGFCLTNAGQDTAGLWHMVLDGSAEGMPRNSTDSISLSDDGQTLYLTTKKTFNVDSAVGGHSMVYAYDMGSGSFSGPLFIAADNGLGKKVDGLQVSGEIE